MGAKNLAGSSDSKRKPAQESMPIMFMMSLFQCFFVFALPHSKLTTRQILYIFSLPPHPFHFNFRYPNKRLASKMRRLSNMASPCPIISYYVTPKRKIKLQQICRHHHFVFSIMYLDRKVQLVFFSTNLKAENQVEYKAYKHYLAPIGNKHLRG